MAPDLGPDELLTTTRSVRKRLDLDRPVPVDLVEECIEVALQAPTGSNLQGWHWIVVTDGRLRAAVGEYYSRACAAHRATRTVESPDLDREENLARVRLAGSADHLAEVMGRVPVHVIACLEVGAGLPADNQAGLWGSLLPAAWSYMLAARARGLGTAWTTLHLTHEAEVAALLGIPPHVRQGVLLPTAYYTGDTFRPARRAPVSAVVHHDRWRADRAGEAT